MLNRIQYLNFTQVLGRVLDQRLTEWVGDREKERNTEWDDDEDDNKNGFCSISIFKRNSCLTLQYYHLREDGR